MLTIIKNITCYSPEPLGIRDIFIAGEKIYKITEPEKTSLASPDTTVIDGTGLLAFPGIIDGHVHIIGGGGEEGPQSRIGEIGTADILRAGITTVVGLLGADDQTKSLFALLAKAKALEADGISTYIYAGSYAMPPVTFTGDITRDMLLVDKVIGAGEIAISDHRSSHPDIKELLTLAGKIHIGGMISGKAGLLHLHLGDGKGGLDILNQIMMISDLPADLFLPTHVNRNESLFAEAIDYVRSGGNVDLTSGETEGIDIPDAIERLIAANVNMESITISSDANGSIPCGGTGKIQTLYDDIIRCITKKNLRPEQVFPLVTKNAAMRLKQYPLKGALKSGSHADILILNRDYHLKMLFSMGKNKI